MRVKYSIVKKFPFNFQRQRVLTFSRAKFVFIFNLTLFFMDQYHLGISYKSSQSIVLSFPSEFSVAV